MLAPAETRLLSDALRPPRGFELDQLVVTTYSLDLVSLLSIPLAFTSFSLEDGEGEFLDDPLLLLEGLRRNADRITVFCQAGAVAEPLRRQALFVHLEDCVVPIVAPYGGVFHPKLWVCSYAGTEGRRVARVLCLSRNLTGDRSWDTALCLESTPEPSDHDSKPLADFLGWLSSQALGAERRDRARLISRLARAVGTMKFQPPDGFSSAEFHPMGIPRYRSNPIHGASGRLCVISPFLSASRLGTLTEQAGHAVLVSRAEEIAATDRAALGAFRELYVLNDLAEPEEDMDSPASKDALRGLHAKMYVAERGTRAHLWTGSANATEAAFTRNVEFLIELEGSRSHCGLRALLGAEDTPSFRSLLLPFEPPDDVLVPDEAGDRLLDRIAHAVAALPLRAEVEVVGAAHTVRLRGDVEESLSDLHAFELRVWPITLAPSRSAPLELSSDPAAAFTVIPLLALTEFYVVEVTVEHDGSRISKRFVAQWRLLNAPDGRKEAVLLSLLDDPQRVLAFIRLMLAEPAADVAGVGVLPHLTLVGKADVSLAWATDTDPLFESLVRALEADPAGLDAVARIVDDLEKAGGEGHGRLPPGFLEIWRPIWSAREQMRMTT